MFDVKNKTILITGSTGYFGYHITKEFIKAGAKVIIMARSNEVWEQVRNCNEEFGLNKCFGYQVDFYDTKELESDLINISDNYDVDVVINNAYDLSKKTGFNTAGGRLEDLTYYEWHNAFLSGIYWAVLTTQIIGHQFIRKQKGNIINISSMYGIVAPNPELYEGVEYFNPPTYGVMKAGLIGLTKYTASFWGKHNIRCNAVAPGPFPKNVKDEEFIQKLKDKTLLNDIGVPEDLIGALIFLASDSSRYMTGQIMQIDGGWTVT